MSNIKYSWKIIENNPEYMTIEDRIKYPKETSFMCDVVSEMLFDKQKALEAFTYANLETEALQAIKLNIENELMMRKLKEYGK